MQLPLRFYAAAGMRRNSPMLRWSIIAHSYQTFLSGTMMLNSA